MEEVLKKSKNKIGAIGKKGDSLEIKTIDVYQGKNKVLRTIKFLLFEEIKPNSFVKKIDGNDSSVGIGITGMINSISVKSKDTYILGTDMYIKHEVKLLV